MNWEFHAVQSTDTIILIEQYRAIMEDGIEEWLETHVEPKEVQPKSGYSEYPLGFYHEGPSYSFRIRCGFHDKDGFVYLDPAEYDVSVQQTFFPPSVERQKAFLKRPRIRQIKNISPIE